MKITGAINCKSGTAASGTAEALLSAIEAPFKHAGHDIDLRLVFPEQLPDALERAAAQKSSDMLLVCGGDGTVSLGAGIAYEAKKPLAVVPAGTLNLFARSLKIPLDVALAAEMLAAGTVRNRDIATANGKPFIHQFSVGLQPDIVEEREKLEYNSWLTKLLSGVKATTSVLMEDRNFKASADLEGLDRRQEYSVLTVAANPYGENHLPYADDMNEGVLGVYTAGPLPPGERAKLVADIMTGQWNENPHLIERRTKGIKLAFGKERPQKCTLDGELVALDENVEFQIIPDGLKVLLP